MSFFDPSKSALQPWLEFTGTLPFLGPCTDYEGRATSCSQVCNDSDGVFGSFYQMSTNHNLAICGIWAATLVQYVYNRGLTNLTFNGTTDIIWASLTPLAFNFTSLEMVKDTANLISEAFAEIYVGLVGANSQTSNLVPQVCNVQALFPFAAHSHPVGNFDLGKTMADSLQSCVSQICSPATLNTDLAGIGIFSSFLIQTGIALISFALLLALPHLISASEKVKLHRDSTVTAIIDFHKAQCYFAATVQIAALVLYTQVKILANQSFTNQEQYDLFNSGVMVVLATTGLLPLSFTLRSISQYGGRLSLYLLSLSSVTVILSTATLASSWVVKQDVNPLNPKPQAVVLVDNPYDLAPALCGSSKWEDIYDVGAEGLSAWLWAVWLVCVIQLLYLWLQKMIKATNPVRRGLKRVMVTYQRVWTVILVVVWGLCFGAQIYLCSLYFQHFLISYEWSFGQIIAITVWVPSLFEFIYLEYVGIEEASKYKYPSPFKAMKDIVPQSFAMARLDFEDPQNQDGMQRYDHGHGHDQRGNDSVEDLSLLERRTAG